MAELPSDLDFLKDAGLEPDIKKALIDKIFEERRQERDITAKREEAEAARQIDKKRFWHNTPLVIALTGTITIAANALSGAFLNRESAQNKESLTRIEAYLSEQGKGADAGRQASNEERQFAFHVIEKELAKSNDMIERAGVLLFLVRSGILNGLNRQELEQMALNDLKKSDSDPSSVGIPETLGGLNYQLEIPVGVSGQTQAARTLLEVSTREINRNIDEQTSFSDIKKYWSVVPEFHGRPITPDIPWSGAFVSWAIAQTGNPDKIRLSAANFNIWNSAVDLGSAIDFPRAEVLPGDLVFVARSKDDVAVARSRRRGVPLQPGVVYSVEKGKGLKYIGGNVGNAVRLSEIEFSDQRILGFVRIGQKESDSGASSAVIGETGNAQRQ